jgi:prepilin-type N-terminal cleavage/methylation domain-containing protein
MTRHFAVNRRLHRRGRGQGFTLVEVLVATVVLAIGLLGALTAFSMAARVAGTSNNDTVLPFLAQEKLAEIEALGSFGIAEAETSGDFGPAHPEYKWELIIHDPDERNLVNVDLVITAQESGKNRESWFSTTVF